MKKVLILGSTLFLLGLAFTLPSLHHDLGSDPSTPVLTPPSPPPSRGALRRTGQYEDLSARRAYELRRLADPATGRIPQDIHHLEQEFAAGLPRAEVSVRGDKGFAWASRGPWNVGGRTRALAIDVSDGTHQTILAGGVSGGMWRSADMGATWNLTTGSSQIHSVTSLVQDTRAGHQNVWYYGTGEADGASASYPLYLPLTGDGLFKSVDGGHSWSQLPATAGHDPQNQTDPWQYLWKLAIDPSNAAQDEVYAATWGGIQRSIDGGDTWTHVLGMGGDPATYTDVVVTSTGVVYATLSYDGTTHGAFRSPDGITWTDLTPPGYDDYDRIVLAVAPSNENIVWLVSANTYGVADSALLRYQYLSGNGIPGVGGLLEDRSSLLGSLPGPFGAINYETQESYCQMLTVHPTDPETVYLGGVFMWRSTDGFQTPGNINFIGGWQYPLHHADLHQLVFLPGSTATALTGSDGGVHLTLDVNAGSVSWNPLNAGYNTSQFYSVAIDENLAGSDVTLGGTQDNGTWLGNLDSPLANWFNPLDGDGGYCAVGDASGTEGTYYMSFQEDFGIFRMLINNAGGTVWNWARIDPLGAANSNWLWPFTLDPNDDQVMYLAGDSTLWRNSNLAGIPYGNGSPTTINWSPMFTVTGGSPITALTMSRSTNRILYFGTADGELYRLDQAHSTAPGTAPTRLDLGAGFPAGAYISSIAINPDDDQDVLVGFSSYNVANLFHSLDGGAAWTDVEGNLGGPNSPSVRSVAYLPATAVTYYLAATSTGLYSTHEMAGAATVWSQQAADEIGNVVVDMLAVRPADLMVVAGTHGRGVFRGYLGVSPAPESDLPVAVRLEQNVPNPFNPSTDISFALPVDGHVTLDVFDVAGRRVRTLWTGHRGTGNHTLTWNLGSVTDQRLGPERPKGPFPSFPR